MVNSISCYSRTIHVSSRFWSVINTVTNVDSVINASIFKYILKCEMNSECFSHIHKIQEKHYFSSISRRYTSISITCIVGRLLFLKHLKGKIRFPFLWENYIRNLITNNGNIMKYQNKLQTTRRAVFIFEKKEIF